MADEEGIAEEEITAEQLAEFTEKKPKRRRRWVWLTLIVLLLGGGAGGSWYWMEMQAATEEKEQAQAQPRKKPPTYLSLEPPLIANFESRGMLRFVQSEITLMSRDEEVISAIERHMPVMRDTILMLFTDQNYESLASRVGRERLRAEALAAVREVLRSTGEPDNVEALYFTSFVIQ